MRSSDIDHGRGTTDLVDEPLELGPCGVAAVRWSGAAGDLELDDVGRAEAHHGAARYAARQCRGSWITDHVEGVGAIVQAQRQSQVRVGPDVIVDHTSGPLRGEHEVDSETAAALRDPDEGGDEVGEVDGEGRELVDDDDEAGQRW
jgi:hypothetical protein